jgi:CMP-N-acetylneuraminic acid synthetase
MIAVIPARGGSKGLPRKNVLPLAGVPLIVHSLRCALDAREISRVVVSTDDEEIAAVARSIDGVEVPFMRPAHLASDGASAVDVHLHSAELLGVAQLCVLLPTAPLRLPEDVDASIRLFRQREAEVVLSVTSAKPAAWQQVIEQDGKLAPLPGLAPSVDNRQDYGAAVIPNGAVYVLDMEALARSRTYFGTKSFGHLMPASRSIDIDTPDDLLMAEAILAHRRALA